MFCYAACFVMPDLQSGVIETRICNPHHAAWRMIISCISGCCGLQLTSSTYGSAARLRWITNYKWLKDFN